MSVGHETGLRSQARTRQGPRPLWPGDRGASSPGVTPEGHSGGRRKEQKIPRTMWSQAGGHILSSFPNLGWGSSLSNRRLP